MSETIDTRRGSDPANPGPAIDDPHGVETAVEVYKTSWVRLALLIGVFVLLGTLRGVSLIYVILAIVFSVLLHELGHFVVAKRAGMKVTEAFIGFGPRIWSFRRGETEYGVKVFWLGAYVRIVGMTNLEEVDPADESRTFRQQSYPKRVAVAVAGPVMNLLVAVVLLFVVYAGFGQPESSWPTINVGEGTYAEASGLRTGDQLLEFNGEAVASFDDLRERVVVQADKTVPVVIVRDGQRLTLDVGVGSKEIDGQTLGFLGIRPEQARVRQAPLEAGQSSFSTLGEISVGSVQALGAFFSPDGLSGFANQVVSTPPGDDAGSEPPAPPPTETGGSPSSADVVEDEEADRILSIIGVAGLGAEMTDSDGMVALFSLTAMVNVFLAVFNLVPLPPLDGGHIAVATYERIRSRRGRRYMVDYAKVMPVAYAVIVVLLTVGVGAMYLDVVSPVSVPQ